MPTVRGSFVRLQPSGHLFHRAAHINNGYQFFGFWGIAQKSIKNFGNEIFDEFSVMKFAFLRMFRVLENFINEIFDEILQVLMKFGSGRNCVFGAIFFGRGALVVSLRQGYAKATAFRALKSCLAKRFRLLSSRIRSWVLENKAGGMLRAHE